MNIKEYQQFVKEGASPKYTKLLSIVGLVGEVGELADVIKKEIIYDDMSKFESKYGVTVGEKIIDEAGDCLWQLINVLNMYDLNIETVINYNKNKLLNRHNGVKTSKDGGKR